jgi:hypothetical protein
MAKELKNYAEEAHDNISKMDEILGHINEFNSSNEKVSRFFVFNIW